MKRLLLAVAIGILLQGSTCRDNKIVLPGNISDLSDATSVPCDPYAGDTGGKHICLVLTNPYRHIVRVFDVSDNQFLVSPIGYFPLAVPVGITPERITSLPSASPMVWVLDSALGYLRPISPLNIGDKKSFVPPKRIQEEIKQPLGKRLLALAKDSSGSFWVFVVFGDANIDVTKIDPNSGQELGGGFQFKIGSEHVEKINDIVIDADSNYLAVAGQGGTGLAVFELADIFNQKENALSKIIHEIPHTLSDITKVEVAKMKGDSRIFVLALPKGKKQAILFDLVSGKRLGDALLSGLPLAGYLPLGNRQTCCNGESGPWGAVLTANGNLEYLRFNNFGLPEGENKSKVWRASVAKSAAVSATTTANALKIIGTETTNKNNQLERKMFLIFSGFIASVNEGDKEKIEKVDVQ